MREIIRKPIECIVKKTIENVAVRTLGRLSIPGVLLYSLK